MNGLNRPELFFRADVAELNSEISTQFPFWNPCPNLQKWLKIVQEVPLPVPYVGDGLITQELFFRADVAELNSEISTRCFVLGPMSLSAEVAQDCLESSTHCALCMRWSHRT